MMFLSLAAMLFGYAMVGLHVRGNRRGGGGGRRRRGRQGPIMDVQNLDGLDDDYVVEPERMLVIRSLAEHLDNIRGRIGPLMANHPDIPYDGAMILSIMQQYRLTAGEDAINQNELHCAWMIIKYLLDGPPDVPDDEGHFNRGGNNDDDDDNDVVGGGGGNGPIHQALHAE